MATAPVERLRAIQWHFASHRVLTVANRTGILHRLAGEPATTDRVASDLGLDPLAAAKVVRALCALGLVQAAGEVYALEPELVGLFQPGPWDYGPALEHSHDIYTRWGATLEDWVRTGTMPPRQRTPEGTRRFADAMWANVNVLGPDVVSALDLSGVRRVLDIGGGIGRLAVSLCQAEPELTVTVLDQPEVVALGPDKVAATGVGDRIRFQAGDYLSEGLGADYDLVVLCNVLHQELAPAAARMVRLAAAALAPGGRLAVVDFSIDDRRREVVGGCLFAVNMRSFGDTWTEPEIRGWMSGAGLADVTRTELGPQRWLVVGTRGGGVSG